MRVLVVGDDNLTFTRCYASECGDNGAVYEIAISAPETEIVEAAAERMAELSKLGQFRCRFDVRPNQCREFFGSERFDKLVVILPGLEYGGCPPCIAPNNEMYRLRLHLFAFSLLKSCKNILNVGARIEVLWPDVNDAQVPFLPIEPDKVALFCGLGRDSNGDRPFSDESYQSWLPVIDCCQDVVDMPTAPEWLKKSIWYMLYMPAPNEDVKTMNGQKRPASEYNILKIPHSIELYDFNVLPNINDAFLFFVNGRHTSTLPAARLLMKYDPRTNGWNNDRQTQQNPHTYRMQQQMQQTWQQYWPHGQVPPPNHGVANHGIIPHGMLPHVMGPHGQEGDMDPANRGGGKGGHHVGSMPPGPESQGRVPRQTYHYPPEAFAPYYNNAQMQYHTLTPSGINVETGEARFFIKAHHAPYNAPVPPDRVQQAYGQY